MFSSLLTLTKALSNIFIFLPYFFSVDAMIANLFAPWKRISSKNVGGGFTFAKLGEDISMNLVSRGVGFAVRVSTLLTYLVAQILFLPISLLVIFFYLVFIFPFQFILSFISPSKSSKYESEKQKFLETHLLVVENREKVEQWFDSWYVSQQLAKSWWELDNLFNIVPIGRDWTHGFTPTLEKYSADLSAIASKDDAKPMTIGREKDMQDIEQILCKTNGANILLVGEEGVGKRTVIESLAYRIHIGRGNPLLAFKRLISLNLEKLLSEATDTKVRENILESLFDEAEEAGNIIFVIEDIDKYMSSGEGRVDLSIPIEKFTKSDRVHLIGLTTPYAFQKHLYPKEFLRTAFAVLEIKEVSPEMAFQILLDHSHRFESRYGVFIPYEVLRASVEKSAFFISDIPFPEKALQLLDDACVKLSSDEKSPKNIAKSVSLELIDTVLSTRTHSPVTLTDPFKEKLLNIYDKLVASVIGQQIALKDLSNALQRSFLLLGKRKKPLASFLFLGPTGVGKTETAKILAKEFFDSDASIIRFDMAEFQSLTDIQHLIGDIRSGEPGQLIEKIREKPYGILLLDEIEKAHHDLLNIFLTLLDEGYITDATGRKVDCKSLVIIATSNAGALEFYSDIKTDQTNKVDSKVGDILDFLVTKQYFSPEFLNRFDGVIAFSPLTGLNAYAIASKMINTIASSIAANHGIKIIVKPDTIQSIVRDKFNPAYGARNLERAISQVVETSIAQKILSGEAKSGSTIEI